MEPLTYRGKPVEVDAMRWMGPQNEQGASVEELHEWGVAVEPAGSWSSVVNGREDFTLLVWNSLEQQYIQCPVGHWIIKGIKGEFYPCDDGVFQAKYELVSSVSLEISDAVE
jgi:hypothetical protein